MAIIKCKMCGGDLEIRADSTVYECEYCGTRQTVPKADDEKKMTLFARASRLLRSCEFDKASGVFESIVSEFPDEAEAYWGLVLCKYGIEYVDDPATGKKIPTCHRSSFESVLDDSNYEQACENTDAVARRVYRDEARQIEELRQAILEVSGKEEPYDVFISYKETDENNERTLDSVIAQDIYTELTERGYRVFFSRISLESKLGVEYEPYIFAALNSAKVMLVVGTSYDNFDSVWVKNEWSRFLKLIASGQKKTLIPVFKNMDAYDMPKEFAKLAAQDMGKVGAMQDLVRGVEKLLGKKEISSVNPQQYMSGNANTTPLLKRAFMALEDGEWQRADAFCEQVLNQDPENAQAYLGKLMAELHVKKQAALGDCEKPFDGSSNYQKALRFSDEKLASTLKGYVAHINERNENERIKGIYAEAVKAMNSVGTEEAFKSVAATFRTIPGFNDADVLAEQCLEKAEICRKNSVYASAVSLMTGYKTANYESAIKQFVTISGWMDADEQIDICRQKIEEIKTKEENERLEKERKAEEAAKKRNRIMAIVIPAVIIAVATFFVITKVIIPASNYNKAKALLDAGQHEEAIAAFEALGSYKDSEKQIEEAETALKDIAYDKARALLEAGQHEEAITAFKTLGDYKDSEVQIAIAETALKDIAYDKARALLEAGQYEEAITAYEELGDYKNSQEQILTAEIALKDIEYEKAKSMFEAGQYEEAIAAFSELDDYKDSADQIKQIKPYYYKVLMNSADIGDYIFFGSYEQDNDTSNGKEDIEWLVLAKENDAILVISRKTLDCQPYNTMSTTTSSVTWEKCSLRKWLNSSFLNNAFTKDEISIIPSVTVSADRNPELGTSSGNNTKDQVFLLSIKEANKYFKFNGARICFPTKYARAHNRSDSDYDYWWLRTTGVNASNVANVGYDGHINDYGDYAFYDYYGVRPAMWINIG